MSRDDFMRGYEDGVRAHGHRNVFGDGGGRSGSGNGSGGVGFRFYGFLILCWFIFQIVRAASVGQ